jgi:hypothetical protein
MSRKKSSVKLLDGLFVGREVEGFKFYNEHTLFVHDLSLYRNLKLDKGFKKNINGFSHVLFHGERAYFNSSDSSEVMVEVKWLLKNTIVNVTVDTMSTEWLMNVHITNLRKKYAKRFLIMFNVYAPLGDPATVVIKFVPQSFGKYAEDTLDVVVPQEVCRTCIEEYKDDEPFDLLKFRSGYSNDH